MKLWYAVYPISGNRDWGDGNFSKSQAITMAEEYEAKGCGQQRIDIVDVSDNDPMLMGTITRDGDGNWVESLSPELEDHWQF